MALKSGFKCKKKMGKGRTVRRTAAFALAGMMTAGLAVSAFSAGLDAQDMVPVCGLEEHVHTEACYSYPEPAQLICREVDPYLQNVHVHAESCYAKDAEGHQTNELICPYADFVLHKHDASCYDSNGNLICPIPENEGHKHTDACYTEQKVLVCTEQERPAVEGHTHSEACYTLTNTGKLICGQEERPADEGHTHTDACYVLVNTGKLICGQNERPAVEGHFHTEYCYDEAGNLVCGLAEVPADAGHTHTEDCYEHVWQLNCGQEERAADPGHKHTEDCYEHEWKLTCGKEEAAGDPGHTHTDACYVTQKVLICGNLLESYLPHVHTEACLARDENGNLTNTLICGMAEVHEHVHTAACYPQTEPVLICGIPEHIHTAECYPQMPQETPLTELTQPAEEVPAMEVPQETVYDVPAEELPQEITDTVPETEEVQAVTELLPEGEELVVAEPQPLVEETDAAETAETEAVVEETSAPEEGTEDGQAAEASETEAPAEEAESEKESEPAEDAVPAEENVTEEETEAMEIVEKEVSDVEVQYDGTMVDPGWIGNVSLETSDADSAQGEWNQADVDSVIKVRKDQMLKFKVTLDLDGGLLTADNRTLVYQVPWQIRAVDASAGEVLDYEGKLIAQYLISEGGLVTVTFSDDYAQRSAAGDPLAVAVEFTTSVANLAWDQAG